MSATVRIAGLRGYIPTVEKLGGDANQLCADCGIDIKIFADEDALISYRQLSGLLEYTARQLAAPDLGLQIAANQDIDVLGPLALAIQNSNSVADAMQCAASYLFVHSAALKLEITEAGEYTDLYPKIVVKQLTPVLSSQAHDKAIAMLHGILKLLAQDSYQPEKVCLPHPPLCEQSVYETYFGAAVTFNSTFNKIRVPSKFMDTNLESRNEHIRKIALQFLHQQQPTVENTLCAKVENLILRSLGTESCNRDEIARALAMHPRTLQRQLKELGVSFVDLRDRVRRSRAEHYLQNTQVPLSQIAHIIGYSDQSLLTRSCVKWFGSTPLQLRNLHS